MWHGTKEPPGGVGNLMYLHLVYRPVHRHAKFHCNVSLELVTLLQVHLNLKWLSEGSGSQRETNLTKWRKHLTDYLAT